MKKTDHAILIKSMERARDRLHAINEKLKTDAFMGRGAAISMLDQWEQELHIAILVERMGIDDV